MYKKLLLGMLMLLTATQHGMMKYADHIVLIADASLLKNNAAAAVN